MKYYLIVNQDKNFILEKFYNLEEKDYRIKELQKAFRICNRQYPKLIVIEKEEKEEEK